MGHTNSTVNYNLPQFVGTDKPSWLGDVNGAFLAIDTAIAAAKTEADSAAGGVAGLQVTVGSHTTQIGTLTDTVTAQGGTLNTVTALIGNGEPTTTDKTIIGAINELNAEIGSEVVEVTVNSGETWASFLGRVNAALSGKTLSAKTIMEVVNPNGFQAYQMQSVSSGTTTFTFANETTSGVLVYRIDLATTCSYTRSLAATGGTITRTDYTSDPVATQGATSIKIYL